MIKPMMKPFVITLLCLAMSACGFKLQGERQLAAPLHTMYLQTPDTYGYLERNLKDNLKMSGVTLVNSPDQAKTLLIVTSDATAQDLLSVSSTQQTRQYGLRVIVTFEVTTPDGQILMSPQTLQDMRAITVQSNQILGSSNESALYYQQMRRSIASSIMNRLASTEVTKAINDGYKQSKRLTP